MSVASIGAALEGFARGKSWKDDRAKEREIMDLRREELAIRRMEAENGRIDWGDGGGDGAGPAAGRSIEGGGAARAASAPHTGGPGGEASANYPWLRYANRGATRNMDLSERLGQYLNSYLPDMGLTMEVFSGGQPGIGSGGARVGSTRHDHGDAADVYFYNKDGRRLDWANTEDQAIFSEIVSRGRAAGITGFGAGEGYMRPGAMHIGLGTPGVWGAGGRGANAAPWLRTAYETKWVPPQQAQTDTGRQAAAAPVPEAATTQPPASRRADDRKPRGVLSFGDEILKMVKG